MILVKSKSYHDLGLDHQVQINELFERCSHSPSALIGADSPVKQSQANHSYIKWLFSFCTLLPFTSRGKWCYCLITEKAHENLASPIWASPGLVMNKARPSAQNIITTLVIQARIYICSLSRRGLRWGNWNKYTGRAVLANRISWWTAYLLH